MKTITIESSVLEQDRPTGVNYFTSGIVAGLEELKNPAIEIRYFWLNFLGRKPIRNNYIRKAASEQRAQMFRLIPQRVYAKLVYAGIAPPLPVRRTDWQLYPNFYIWPTLYSSKKLVIIHDLCFMRYPEYVEEKNRSFLNRVAVRSMKYADAIISNSQFTTNELVRYAGVPASKIITLNIPVDSARFLPELDRGFTHLTNRYQIEKPYILTLGTLEPRKNLTMLVEAYCQLPERIRANYSLVLAGKWGWKTDELRSLIEKKQSEGYDIVIPGHIDDADKCTFYRNASFSCLTTHYEGFGMPLLEALHCGIPTVAVDIPVLREVGGDACLWSAKTSTDVAANLTALINSPELQAFYAKRGPGRSRQFSWQKTSKILVDELLNR